MKLVGRVILKEPLHLNCEQFYVLLRTSPQISEEAVEKDTDGILDGRGEHWQGGAVLRRARDGTAHPARRHAATIFTVPPQ